MASLTTVPQEVKQLVFQCLGVLGKSRLLTTAPGAAGVHDPAAAAREWRSAHALLTQTLQPLTTRQLDYPGLTATTRLHLELPVAALDDEMYPHIVPEIWGFNSGDERDINLWLAANDSLAHQPLDAWLQLNHGSEVVAAAANMLRLCDVRLRWFPCDPAGVDAGNLDMSGSLVIYFDLGGVRGSALAEDPALLENSDSDPYFLEDDFSNGGDDIDDPLAWFSLTPDPVEEFVVAHAWRHRYFTDSAL